MPELAINSVTDLVTPQNGAADIDGRIAQANGRLKASKVRVSIERRGGALWLRGTFPPKPGSVQAQAYRQKLALGVKANTAGVQHAEKQARLMGAQLQMKQFNWADWIECDRPSLATVAAWVKRYSGEYQHTVEPISWQKDYLNAFAKLPADEPLTAELLKRVLLQVKDANPNSRTQRRCALAFGRLAAFAKLDIDLKHLRGGYSSDKSPDPRDIPSDELIAKCWKLIPDPGWRWVYGMMATFGLRGHEPFYLDTEELQAGGWMVALKEGKTGARLIWACYPEWIDHFGLRSPVLPAVTGKEHSDYTQRVSQYFGRADHIPFTALDLRHAWAIRTLACGLPYSEAAAQMGHSVTVHEKTYHRWITKETRQKLFDAVMWRSDRPLPPT